MSEAVQPLQVETLSLGPIGTNCFIAWRQGSDRCVVVDPGAEADRVLDTLRERGLAADAVLVTHCHWDHIGAVPAVARALGVPVYMSALEAQVLENPADYAPAQFGPYEPYSPDVLLEGNESFTLAGIEFATLHLPGHSPGTIGFLVREPAPVLFVGDVIFQDSVGRFDLPFADGPTLFASIRGMFDLLPDETVLHPGHGPSTTIGRERAHNPFVREFAGNS